MWGSKDDPSIDGPLMIDMFPRLVIVGGVHSVHVGYRRAFTVRAAGGMQVHTCVLLCKSLRPVDTINNIGAHCLTTYLPTYIHMYLVNVTDSQ